jgi:hypothetical protein
VDFGYAKTRGRVPDTSQQHVFLFMEIVVNSSPVSEASGIGSLPSSVLSNWPFPLHNRIARRRGLPSRLASQC